MTIDLRAVRVVEGTKVSHDYDQSEIVHFPLSELIRNKIPEVGIPCNLNRLIVIDIDVPSEYRSNDGRPFWTQFCKENGIPNTYTVMTGSGGYHFYFWLPKHVDAQTFFPPKQLADGVDVKWNGWVKAPPTVGYHAVWGTHENIIECPPSLMLALLSHTAPSLIVSDAQIVDVGALHYTAFTPEQILELRSKIRWVQTNGTLTRDEWRDGIFSLKAGLHESPEILEELVTAWTQNGSYQAGDEYEALSIAERATPFGKIGPGTIFAIITQVMQRVTSPALSSSFTLEEVLGKAQIIPEYNKKTGTIKVEPSESNAAAIINALYSEDELYHDVRQDLYVFKGRPESDENIVNSILPVIQRPLQGIGLDKFKKSIVKAGLDVAMITRRVDPLAEHIKTLQWDGVPRIEMFFIKYLGCEDNEYYRTLGKNLWTATVARTLSPGCKFDHMFVLEGKEGLRKSSLVEALGGEYTYATSTNDAFSNLDSLRQMHQASVIELPELKGLVGVDGETIKAFVSKPFDHIRALFAKKAVKNLRSFILIGTTNSKRYLTRAMGGRRFWPVSIPEWVHKIDVSEIKLFRDQFLAEGLAMFKDGYEFWNIPPEILNPMIDMRVEENTLETPVKEAIRMYGEGSFFTTYDVFQYLAKSGAVTKGFNKYNISKIEEALELIGVEKNGSQWVAPANPNSLESRMVNYSFGGLI